MNLNVIGGALGMAALVALLLHGRHATPVLPAPASVVTAPAPIAPLPIQPPAPAVKPTPAATKPAIPNVIYHRVEQGGAQGPEIACNTSVKLFADGKSPAELAATAKQYGVSVDILKRYYVCT